MLAPGDPTDLTQVIDARDLAAFLLDGLHRGRNGVFNLTGNPRPFGLLLDLCRTATYSDADLVWIDSERLVGSPSPVRSFYVITLRSDASVVGIPVSVMMPVNGKKASQPPATT